MFSMHYDNTTKPSIMESYPNLRSTRDALHFALPYIHGKVLDAGGGSAAKYRSLILSRASTYVCLDARPGGFTDIVGDVMSMPFEGESFDSVICNQVLEHVPKPKKVIIESVRVLKRSGHFVCTAPFLEPNHADPGDYFRYTKQGLEELCVECGLSIIHAQPYGGIFSVIYSFVKFKWFNPYNKLSSLRKRISRWLGYVFLNLDSLTPPGIVYSDVLIIAKKK